MRDLAHELVHTLSPDDDRPVLSLEEGIAVHFSVGVLGRVDPAFIPQVRPGPDCPNYRDALEAYEMALALNPTFVREARAEAPNLSTFTPDLLVRHVPGIPPRLADLLCSRFVYDWNALACACDEAGVHIER